MIVRHLSAVRGAHVRRAIGAAALLAFGTAVPAQADTRRIGLTSFERVEVYGDMIVEIAPSNRIGAVAEASRAALETLSMEVNDRTLVIRQLAEGPFGPRRAEDGAIVIRITAQNLAQVMLRGSGRVTVAGLRGSDVRVDLDGAGTVTAAVPAGTAVHARAIGAGQISLTGAARTLLAITNGAAAIDASGLSARDVTVRATGTGSSQFAASVSADIVSIGSADVTVTGRARCSVRNTGAGTVSCGARSTTPLER